MKSIVMISTALLCIAGLLTAARMKRMAEAPLNAAALQVAMASSNLPAVRIDHLSVSNGVATFTASNLGSEPITALAFHSGRYRLVHDTTYGDANADMGMQASRNLSLTLDGAEPLSVDAVIYGSGKGEGDAVEIEKIRNIRQGFKAGMAKIQNTIQAHESVDGLKTAISGLSIREQDFQSMHQYYGASDARDAFLDRLSRIDSSAPPPEVARRVQRLKQWVAEKSK